MTSTDHFNDRLGTASCRRFDIDLASDGTQLAVMLMLVEALAVAARSQPDPDGWLRRKRLELVVALERVCNTPEGQDALRHGLDTVDLVTGQAWGRVTAKQWSASDGESGRC